MKIIVETNPKHSVHTGYIMIRHVPASDDDDAHLPGEQNIITKSISQYCSNS